MLQQKKFIDPNVCFEIYLDKSSQKLKQTIFA